ncbi:MAG: PD-(D/E)XK nuclease family protein [Chloroflexota bacterium]
MTDYRSPTTEHRFSIMHESFSLSRGKLVSFLTCQRQFQLRYLQRLPWPVVPLAEPSQALLDRGQQFHQLLQRHFLGLEIIPAAIADDAVRRWWSLFQRYQAALPHGRFLTEISLTVPLDGALLNGRFDLLILGEKDGTPFAHLFDWKTGKAQDEATLRQDWQTRLYLALLAAGGAALLPPGHALLPEQIAITYWYVTEPDAPRTLHYNTAWHTQNWADLAALVAQITALDAEEPWPLTADWSACQNCAYRVLCGRQDAGSQPVVNPDEEAALLDWALEPELP